MSFFFSFSTPSNVLPSVYASPSPYVFAICIFPPFLFCFSQCLSLDFLLPPIQSEPRFQPQLPALCRPLRTLELMTQSTAMRAERGWATGAHSELCHCPPEQTQSWGNRERERGGGETGRETRNQLVREGWQSDSQCTITLVFRFGPSERSFWTHLCLDISSYSFFLLLFFLHGAPSNGNTFLSCLTAVPCLDFSLQTALHAWAGAGRSTSQGEAGDLSPPQPPGER